MVFAFGYMFTRACAGSGLNRNSRLHFPKTGADTRRLIPAFLDCAGVKSSKSENSRKEYNEVFRSTIKYF